MSNPHFETWERENLVKFCKEAYDKLQRQEEELQELRWAQQEKSSLADALYERMKEEMQMRERSCAECGKSGGWALYCVKCMERIEREWFGLTESEKVNVALDCGCADVAWMDFADAIEAKLREKNA